MDSEKETKIIVIHETVADSWLKDLGLFGSVGVLLAFNHILWGGNAVVSVLLILFLIIYAVSLNDKHVKTFESYKDVRKYINSKEFDGKDDIYPAKKIKK